MVDSSQGTEQKVAKDKTIGQVLSVLDAEFAGISASKIRFLEDKGLIHPHRTNTGYRKYSAKDIDQLRFILRMQRDHYLPLKVIKERLESGELDISAGEREPSVDKSRSLASRADASQRPPRLGLVSEGEGAAEASSVFYTADNHGKTYTLRELSAETAADMPLLRELINFGLLAEEGPYDVYDVVVTKVCSELTAHGLQPRHLRQFRAAAEREVGLVEMAVAPLASRKDEQSQRRAAERAAEIAQLCLRLHMALVASSMPGFEG